MILGIDPGLTGALALFEPSVASLHSILDMPTLVFKRGAGAKREIDLHNLTKFLSEHRESIHHVYLEWVGPMPRQGVSGVYQFGRGVGQLEGMLAALALPVTYLTPQKWQAKGRVRSGKDGAVRKAREVFPERAEWFTKNKHGRADAALIAWVGSERLDT